MKYALPFIAVLLLSACGKPQEAAAPEAAAPAIPGAAGLPLLPAAGDKAPLPGGGWLSWQFAEKPKIGTIVMKAKVFDASGAQVQPFDLVGEFGMPSMRYHDSGPVAFKLNKKGDYLLPVELVMPGEWEVVLRVKQGKEEIYAGRVLFTI
jgi:hypothetical protein